MDIRKICEDIAYGRTNRDEIYKFADNQIIYIDNMDKNISQIVVDIYVDGDKQTDEELYENFLNVLRAVYKKDFSKQSCFRCLVGYNLDKILKKENTFYDGLIAIEKMILSYYGTDDIYGEKLNQKLSEIMHSFDIDCSLMFSKYDEKKAIEEINKIYDKSYMVEILELVSESLLSKCPWYVTKSPKEPSCLKNAMPKEEDFYYDGGCDERWLRDELLGKDIDFALQQCENGSPFYLYDMYWIGTKAFRYYVFALFRYIQNRVCSDDIEDKDNVPSAVSVALKMLQVHFEREPKEMRCVAEYVCEFANWVIENYECFYLDSEIYGDLKSEWKQLKNMIEKVQ